MRIIAGMAKGHTLKPPKGIDIRPTSDRVKESIFNILQYNINDSIIIDLYAGTGNLGIEALSRGAQKCYFVDQDSNSIEIIKENLKKTKLSEGAEIIKSDSKAAINGFKTKNIMADLIFMDPPYDKGLIIPTLEAIGFNNVLNKEGIIIIEHDKNDSPPEAVSNLVKFRSKSFGNTCVSFYQLREEV
ncbi:16S rRNA (guanine(966)-N(2))-methyltransferase RsmD [Alkaliphilus pronyensis]|uniref:16S rRNA (Guanine(966)-N(2))-methyltransferase RsmD n=1 Tax=Alkaliphilus pronyensis TaxID=1482732 RepID=A0A6I0FBU4_9FIRM|nr:16S rRNA (guanine(966)-N(2))-methyltransferase RsmD [Alkaliphilus pronyensis]KAB3535220.1 16S rRNA (guanine(966)-N(2))-methyltransferase RsmD [Alkaliphilus pronyensis]